MLTKAPIRKNINFLNFETVSGVSTEVRSIRSHGTGGTGACELPPRVLGIILRSSAGSGYGLTAGLSLCPLLAQTFTGQGTVRILGSESPKISC